MLIEARRTPRLDMVAPATAERLAAVTPVDVLVVDDDPETLYFLTTCLAEEGYQVVSARSGDEALAVLAAARPGLILLDLLLPDIDGWTILHQMQQARVNVPVILISGAPVSRLQLNHPSVVEFVPKPFDLNRLLGSVAHILINTLEQDSA